MVKVVDNLLSPEEFKKLNDVLMGPEFPENPSYRSSQASRI